MDENLKRDLELSFKRAQQFYQLEKGSHIHLVGVCGTGMSGAAKLLKDRGFYITGSDKAFYPPMGDVAKSICNEIFESYSADNLINNKNKSFPRLVVIGNALSRGNPEIEAILSSDLPYMSMPELFSSALIGGYDQSAKSVVVCGTHGKTTTTSMIATALDEIGKAPGFFIGGIPPKLGKSIRGVDQSSDLKDRVVVLEGDEYHSAFFAHWPKFLSYRPDIVVLTSVEFDHADIYSTLDEIDRQFYDLLTIIPKNGIAFINIDKEHIKELFNRWKSSDQILCRLVSYGVSPESDIVVESRVSQQSSDSSLTSKYSQNITVKIEGQKYDFSTPLSGEYNALNAVATFAVMREIGISYEQIKVGISSFNGTKRRQELIYQDQDFIVLEDFAHHPTAIFETLKGIAERFTDYKIVAAFEPKSNTSRRSIFQKEFSECFEYANEVFIKDIVKTAIYSKDNSPVEFLNLEKLIFDIQSKGKKAEVIDDINIILEYIRQSRSKKTVLVLMSNSDFSGLPQKIKNLALE